MASAPASFPVTKCPPGEAQGARLDTHAFGGIRRYPVGARFAAEGEVESTGISFDDFARMGTQQHKLSGERQIETPSWALNYSTIAKVTARYVETRVQLKPANLPEYERICRVQNYIQQQRIPRMEATLEKLCKRYVAEKQMPDVPADSLDKLAEEIESLDTNLRVSKSIAAIAVHVVYLYYRCGFDSVGVANEVGIKPPHVRQMLMSLRKVAFDMGLGEAPQKRPKRVKILHEELPPIRLCRTCEAFLEDDREGKYCARCWELRQWKPSVVAAPVPTIPVRNPRYAATFVRNRNSRHAQMFVRKPCVRCGGPKPPIRGRKFCDSCQMAAQHRVVQRNAAPAVVGTHQLPTQEASQARDANQRALEKRHAVVSSPEFVALFEKVRAKMCDPNRSACVHGHPICPENAHVGDLRRLERYSCHPCNRIIQARYNAMKSAVA